MHLSDEDLELYVLASLPVHQLSSLESHLTNCELCARRLAEAAALRSARQQPGDYKGVERRREDRILCDDSGQMQAFSPFSFEKLQVRIMDISRNGLKVRSPQLVGRGTIVQVLVPKAIILGEVRYCVPAGSEFYAGIQIQDILPRRGR
jgi:hypothetical protein